MNENSQTPRRDGRHRKPASSTAQKVLDSLKVTAGILSVLTRGVALVKELLDFVQDGDLTAGLGATALVLRLIGVLVERLSRRSRQ